MKVLQVPMANLHLSEYLAFILGSQFLAGELAIALRWEWPSSRTSRSIDLSIARYYDLSKFSTLAGYRVVLHQAFWSSRHSGSTNVTRFWLDNITCSLAVRYHTQYLWQGLYEGSFSDLGPTDNPRSSHLAWNIHFSS